MLAELDEIDLFVVGVPVAANALEAACAVMQRMRAHAHVRLVEGNDAAIEVGEATVGSRDHLSADTARKWKHRH